MAELIRGKAVVPGWSGVDWAELLASDQPLSFWGGYDPHSGEIMDRRHPLWPHSAAGRVLAVPFSRGSSTTTAVLLEAARAGTAPAAIVTSRLDPFLALASILARELYGRAIPLVAVEPDDFARLRTGDRLRVEADGSLLRMSI